jgi:hypothetical protein
MLFILRRLQRSKVENSVKQFGQGDSQSDHGVSVNDRKYQGGVIDDFDSISCDSYYTENVMNSEYESRKSNGYKADHHLSTNLFGSRESQSDHSKYHQDVINDFRSSSCGSYYVESEIGESNGCKDSHNFEDTDDNHYASNRGGYIRQTVDRSSDKTERTTKKY